MRHALTAGLLLTGGSATAFFATFFHGFGEALLLAIGVALFIEFLRVAAQLLGRTIRGEYGEQAKRWFQVGAGVAFSVFAFMGGWYAGYPWIKPYPRPDGLIADFKGGVHAPARTVYDGRFDIFVDSEWNLSASTAWYERIPEGDGPGFFRVHYALNPQGETNIPYAGVFADLSLPPAHPYDLSRFEGLEFKVKAGPGQPSEDPRLIVAIASANIHTADYDYCEIEVPARDVTTSWVLEKVAFRDLSAPSWAPPRSSPPRDCHFDSSEVFRVTFALKGNAGVSSTGYVDLSEISFYH